MFAGKPVIGIAGGIGSGKTTIARLFGMLGCFVIHSDAQVNQIYRDPTVVETLKRWWGDQVLDAHGELDRHFIATTIFNHPAERRRLEELLHPLIDVARRQAM